jgi:hypothetical protein
MKLKPRALHTSRTIYPEASAPSTSSFPLVSILYLLIQSSLLIYPPQILLVPVNALRPCNTLQLSKINTFPGTNCCQYSFSFFFSNASNFLAASYHISTLSTGNPIAARSLLFQRTRRRMLVAGSCSKTGNPRYGWILIPSLPDAWPWTSTVLRI